MTRSLAASYGKTRVLQDVWLRVEKGEVVGILGRNGVGKTTTLRALMGLVVSRSGVISLGGEEIQHLSADRIARLGVGYVPQGRHVFPHLTVLENLKLAYHGAVLDQAALESVFDNFPPMRDKLKQLAGSLSGGEQQMLTMSRVLLNQPRVALLDEPAEGLAPSFVNTVRELIEAMRKRGVAVLLVEQNLRLALSVCDRVYFMEKGTIKFSGSVEEASRDEVLMHYLGVRGCRRSP